MAPAQKTCLFLFLLALPALSQEISLTFHGGARQVGGSCYELTVGDDEILLDYGLFHSHGEESGGTSAQDAGSETRPTGEKNAGRVSHPVPSHISQPFDVSKVSSVIISHVHSDHIGRLPLLYKAGYRGPIHATRVSKDLAQIMLGMSLKYLDLGPEEFYGSQKSQVAHTRKDCEQGQQISRKNRVEFNATRPGLEQLDKYVCSTCTELEAADIVNLWVSHDYGEPFDASPHVKAWFIDAAHVPGSAMTICETQTTNGPYRVAYSGDYGNGLHHMLNQPGTIDWAQTLIVESTYGGESAHYGPEPFAQFNEVVGNAVGAGDRVVIPAFTFDRSQKVLQALGEGMASGGIPKTPVWVTSRAAEEITQQYRDFRDDPERYGTYFSKQFFEEPLFMGMRYQVMKISRETELPKPVVLVTTSADGMYSASRELFEQLLGDTNATFVNVGWAPPETPSGQVRAMVADPTLPREIKLDDKVLPFLADAQVCHMFSAHADQAQVTALVKGCGKLEHVFLVHGEEAGMKALAEHVKGELKPEVKIDQPALGEKFELVR